jgi:hypothetical protein
VCCEAQLTVHGGYCAGCEGVWGFGGITDCSLKVHAVLGASGQLHAPTALYPGKDAPVPTEEESGSNLEAFWTFGGSLLRLLENGLAACRVVAVLGPLCWVRCTGSVVLGALFWVRCVGCAVLGPLCWVRCAGSVVLGELYWVRCVGCAVLGPLCWLRCAGSVVLCIDMPEDGPNTG